MLLFACKVSSKTLNDIPWQCLSIEHVREQPFCVYTNHLRNEQFLKQYF